MLSLAIWYMSIAGALDAVLGISLVLLIIIGALGLMNAGVHLLEGDEQTIPFKWVKVWSASMAVVVALVSFVPTDPGQVAYLINSNIAIAEQEGRSVPKLNATEQSLINAMSTMYVTKRHERYIAANQEGKKK